MVVSNRRLKTIHRGSMANNHASVFTFCSHESQVNRGVQFIASGSLAELRVVSRLVDTLSLAVSLAFI